MAGVAPVKRRRRTRAEIELAERKALAARKHWLKVRHHMTLEQYDEIKAAQGGVCYLCRRANGTRRELAVDHDHAIAKASCDHPEKESCSKCWRGLLCSLCNKTFAHARDSISFFHRGIEYLEYPPAQARALISGQRYTDRHQCLMPCTICGVERCQMGEAYCLYCRPV